MLGWAAHVLAAGEGLAGQGLAGQGTQIYIVNPTPTMPTTAQQSGEMLSNKVNIGKNVDKIEDIILEDKEKVADELESKQGPDNITDIIGNNANSIMDEVEVAKQRLSEKKDGSILFNKDAVENEKQEKQDSNSSQNKEVKLKWIKY